MGLPNAWHSRPCWRPPNATVPQTFRPKLFRRSRATPHWHRSRFSDFWVIYNHLGLVVNHTVEPWFKSSQPARILFSAGRGDLPGKSLSSVRLSRGVRLDTVRLDKDFPLRPVWSSHQANPKLGPRRLDVSTRSTGSPKSCYIFQCSYTCSPPGIFFTEVGLKKKFGAVFCYPKQKIVLWLKPTSCIIPSARVFLKYLGWQNRHR